MPEFNRFAIYVTLSSSPFRVLMASSSADVWLSSWRTIVFADPEKMRPIIERQIATFPGGGKAWSGAFDDAKRKLQEAKAEFTARKIVITPDMKILPPISATLVTQQKYVTEGILRRRRLALIPKLTIEKALPVAQALIAFGSNFIPLAVANNSSHEVHALVGGQLSPQSPDAYVVPSALSKAMEEAFEITKQSSSKLVDYCLAKHQLFEEVRTGAQLLMAGYDHLVNQNESPERTLIRCFDRLEMRLGKFTDEMIHLGAGRIARDFFRTEDRRFQFNLLKPALNRLCVFR